jgi:hypothetical protein
MKGFYFSMDALIASMILLATTAMIMDYRPSSNDYEQPSDLANLHAASMQEVADWNNSRNSQKTVLGQIYTLYYEESPSEAENLCSNYFNLSQTYALYVSNSTDRQKICGSYTPSTSDELASSQAIIPDTPVNSEFRGPYTATMVMKN